MNDKRKKERESDDEKYITQTTKEKNLIMQKISRINIKCVTQMMWNDIKSVKIVFVRLLWKFFYVSQWIKSFFFFHSLSIDRNCGNRFIIHPNFVGIKYYKQNKTNYCVKKNVFKNHNELIKNSTKRQGNRVSRLYNKLTKIVLCVYDRTPTPHSVHEWWW